MNSAFVPSNWPKKSGYQQRQPGHDYTGQVSVMKGRFYSFDDYSQTSVFAQKHEEQFTHGDDRGHEKHFKQTRNDFNRPTEEIKNERFLNEYPE